MNRVRVTVVSGANFKTEILEKQDMEKKVLDHLKQHKLPIRLEITEAPKARNSSTQLSLFP